MVLDRYDKKTVMNELRAICDRSGLSIDELGALVDEISLMQRTGFYDMELCPAADKIPAGSGFTPGKRETNELINIPRDLLEELVCGIISYHMYIVQAPPGKPLLWSCDARIPVTALPYFNNGYNTAKTIMKLLNPERYNNSSP